MPDKDYSIVAQIYAHLMRSINYKMWAKYIYELSKINKKKNISVLELAGGSGQLASFLIKKFKNYFLCDLSLPMLLLSEKKYPARINCDIRSLPFKNKFDFIFSTFDSVNYLLTKKAFVDMLESVESCLDENGVFTFDVSLETNSINNVKYLNRVGEYKGMKYEQISSYNRKTRIHQNRFVITTDDGKVHKENHMQRAFPFDDIFDMISKTNLYVYSCYEAFGFCNASSKSERAQFVLKKRKSNAHI